MLDKDILLVNFQKQFLLHYIFIISQLWLTSHPRSTAFLLDTGTPGTSREIYSKDAAGETRTRNRYKPSALAIELNGSKAIAGKELSLSSWCIASLYIYHFSTVVDFSSEKYSVSTPGVASSHSQPRGCEFESHHWHPHCKFLC